jgi:hypothetical protein
MTDSMSFSAIRVDHHMEQVMLCLARVAIALTSQ